MEQRKTRQGIETLYTKTIGIDPVDLLYIDSIKCKKSKSGMLKEIINQFKKTSK